MTTTIAIIGCGARKADSRRHARELYTGTLFRSARDHVESRGVPYAILSARWGLVAPWAPLDPYDVTVQQQRATLGSDAWKVWCHVQGGGLLHQLEIGCFALAVKFSKTIRIEVHAGAEYARWVHELLAERHADGGRLDLEVVEPLAGLEIGERMGWYAQRRAPEPRDPRWWWPEGARSQAPAGVGRKASGQVALFGGPR